MYDIVIIGAGPSGSNLARLLGKHYKILHIERRDFSRSSAEKSCGGLLNPDARMVISRLGLAIPEWVMEGPQTTLVRAIDIDNNFDLLYKKEYLNIDRPAFDKWMFSLSSNYVEQEQNSSFLNCEYVDDHLMVRYRRSSGLEREVEAKLLIGADGAYSKVRSLVFPNSEPSRRVFAYQEMFENLSACPHYIALFSSRINNYYSWAIPKHEGLLVGTALESGKMLKKTFSLLKMFLESRGVKLGKKLKSTSATLTRPRGPKDIFRGSGLIAFVGEAAGYISPSSSEGMSYAFESSTRLARAIREDMTYFHDIYARETRYMNLNIFLKHKKSFFMYSPKLRKLAMKTGIGVIKPITTDYKKPLVIEEDDE